MDKMKMILALLVAKFPGVRKDGLNMLARLMALQMETEDEAKAAVERLTRDGVDAFVRDFRSDVDKEVSDGTRTFEENLRRKFDFVEKQSEPRADEVKPKADPSSKEGKRPNAEVDLQAVVANAVANAVRPLKEQLERYERGNVNQSRLQALTDRLNACKDESFRAKALKDFGRMTFDTEEAFNEYLTDTETDVADANKRMADAKLAGGPAGPGEFGRVPGKSFPASAEAASLVSHPKKVRTPCILLCTPCTLSCLTPCDTHTFAAEPTNNKQLNNTNNQQTTVWTKI